MKLLTKPVNIQVNLIAENDCTSLFATFNQLVDQRSHLMFLNPEFKRKQTTRYVIISDYDMENENKTTEIFK